MRLALTALAMTATMLLFGCAQSPVYQFAPDSIPATPAQVAHTPERYTHAHVIWGGKVISVSNMANDTEIEILAFPLDAAQRPSLDRDAGGRFIAILKGYQEPLSYPRGSLITIQGTLHGQRVGKVGQASYIFPLVRAVQWHHWRKPEQRTQQGQIILGVGI